MLFLLAILAVLLPRCRVLIVFMVTRSSVHKKFDYCLSPVPINTRNGLSYVPCGKCSGCLLHKSNVWMIRLGMEIENNPLSFSFTLTYSNDFLPTLVLGLGRDGNIHWISDHKDNIRFDGTKIVPRSSRYEYFELDRKYSPIPVTNYFRNDVIAYNSKRDVQLWLKTIRKLVYERFPNIFTFPYSFRYWVNSEYGETLYRPHYHCIFFFPNKEVADFVIECCLYQAWQMCDKFRLFNKSKYCDKGASRYLTAYFNSLSLLPQVYQESEIRPFRLSSKNPAIGYGTFKQDLYEKASIGDLEFNRITDRPDGSFVFRYSKDFINTCFPKCKDFDSYTFDGLCRLYGSLYYAKRRWYLDPDEVRCILFENLSPQDVNCIRAFEKFASEFGKDYYGFSDLVKHYVFILDQVYYKMAMNALKLQYEYEQKLPKLSLDILGIYQNLPQMVAQYSLSDNHLFLDNFFAPFGIVPSDIAYLRPCEWMPDSITSEYLDDLSDILQNMVKLPKFREQIGNSPVNCFT